MHVVKMKAFKALTAKATGLFDGLCIQISVLVMDNINAR